jgi:hypothetical protein
MALQPGNPIVGGVALRRPAIQSPNFLTGVQGWSINADGSAEFDNLTIRGKFDGTNYEINSSGLFFYSGTPANGNLIISIARSSGTDAFGNAYLAGVVSYQGTVFSELVGGELLTGSTADDQPFIVSASTGFATILSGRSLNTQIQAMLTMAAGATVQQIFAGQATGSPVTTRMFEVGGSASVRGTLTTQVGGAEELTAHSLSGFATGFSVGGAASYRLCASPPNTVQLHLRNIAYNGTGTSTDGATILSAANGLPASYRPNSAQRLAAWSNLLRQPSAGVFEAVAVEVETDGSLQIFGLANGATRLDVVGLYALDM